MQNRAAHCDECAALSMQLDGSIGEISQVHLTRHATASSEHKPGASDHTALVCEHKPGARNHSTAPFPNAGLARPISPCKRLENPDFAEASRQNSAQPQTTPRESLPNGRQTHFRVAPPFHVSSLSPAHNSVFYSRQIHPNFVFYRRQAILMSPTKPHMQARLSVCDCGT